MPEGPLKSNTGRLTWSLTHTKISPHPFIASQNVHPTQCDIASTTRNLPTPSNSFVLNPNQWFCCYLVFIEAETTHATHCSSYHVCNVLTAIIFLACFTISCKVLGLFDTEDHIWLDILLMGPGHFLAACTING